MLSDCWFDFGNSVAIYKHVLNISSACVILASSCFWKKGIFKCEVLFHSLLIAPCESSMVTLFFSLSSASCLPSNKHHPWLGISLVTWKRNRDQWQSCCHGTVYSCWVEFCCKAWVSQSVCFLALPLWSQICGC